MLGPSLGMKKNGMACPRYRTTVLEQRSHHVAAAVDECTTSVDSCK